MQTIELPMIEYHNLIQEIARLRIECAKIKSSNDDVLIQNMLKTYSKSNVEYGQYIKFSNSFNYKVENFMETEPFQATGKQIIIRRKEATNEIL